jgi:hypothetical protein
LAPRDVPPPPEPQPDSPQYIPQGDDSFEIVDTVPVGEDTQEAQQLLQNNDHDNNHEEEENNEEEEEEEGNKAEGEDDEDYTPLSNTEKYEMFSNADEIKTAGNEAPIPTGRLRDLLNHLNITTHPEFRIKSVSRPRWEEYKAIIEIFSGPNVLSRRKGPAFRATYQDAVANAAWHAITTYNRRYHEELKNTIYHLLPQRKNKFKTSGIKADVPRMLMVHHRDVAVEMSTRLQAAQQEIQKLHDQLRDFDATIRGYQRMVAGEANDLYTSDTYTWSFTTSGPGAKDEPTVNSHSPSGSRTR